MYESTFYTFVHPEYFEPLGRVRTGPEYRAALAQLLPDGWKLSRSDVWLQATSPDEKLPEQGFKIHLTCQVPEAVEMIRSFVPACIASATSFKIIADSRLHRIQSSKRYYRAGSGKFATIYPHSEEIFHLLLELLKASTSGYSGPYILSDRRLPGSQVVFYRYGGIVSRREMQIDGTFRHLLRGPNGESLFDTRHPYVVFPDWVSDPYPQEESSADDSDLLNGRYEVNDALHISNSGGVYRALDTSTGGSVVIKEARLHCVIIAGPERHCLATDALRHECEVLKALSHLPFVPKFVELYEEWEHTFLVQSFFEGIPLGRLRVLEEFILCTNMHKEERIMSFCQTFRMFTIALISMIRQVHKAGVIIGDISPGNVLFNRATGELCFIDLESSLLPDSDEQQKLFGESWSNPGFRSNTRKGSLSEADDFFGLGMLLYSLVCPIQSLFLLDREHPPLRILEYFVAAGLPLQVMEIIQLLFDGKDEAATLLASSWAIVPEDCKPHSLSLQDHIHSTGYLGKADPGVQAHA